MADRRRGEDVAARDDVAEAGVARDLEPHAARAADVVDDGQQRDGVRCGIAGEHALAEAAAAQHVRGPPLATLGRERILRGEHGSGGGARSSQELTSRRHDRNQHGEPADGAAREALDSEVSHY